jgi:sugar phosphate isomerase/epimerase
MATLVFNGANLVGRQLGYTGFEGTPGWMVADAAAQEHFRPVETFAERFGEVLDEQAALGFDAVDLWVAHLHPSWATPEHLALAREALAARGLEAVSVGGRPGETREEFDRTCRVAEGIGARIIAGMSGLPLEDPQWVSDRLEQGGLVWGFENHPEKTPAEVLAKIPEDDSGRMGVTIDTGWWGSQGYDAARAIEEIGERVVYVHLKDVREEGTHVTCRLGDGIVPIERCLEALATIGYTGPISIEHEPPAYDPRDEVVESARRVEKWLERVEAEPQEAH